MCPFQPLDFLRCLGRLKKLILYRAKRQVGSSGLPACQPEKYDRVHISKILDETPECEIQALLKTKSAVGCFGSVPGVYRIVLQPVSCLQGLSLESANMAATVILSGGWHGFFPITGHPPILGVSRHDFLPRRQDQARPYDVHKSVAATGCMSFLIFNIECPRACEGFPYRLSAIYEIGNTTAKP